MKHIKSVLFYQKGDRTVYRNLHWLINALALLIWSAGLGVVCLFFAKGNYAISNVFFGYFSKPLIVFLNLLPVLLITLLVYFIANRVWIAMLLGGFIVIIPTFINNIKLVLRNDPLLAIDVRYISEAANISSRYTLNIDHWMIITVAAIVLMSAAGGFLLRARISSKKLRLTGLAAVILLSALSYVTLYRSEAVYEACENLGKGMSYWSDTDHYVCRGFVYPLIYSTKDLSDGKPSGYNASEAADLYASYPDGSLEQDKRVNVISVMLEAYNDLSKFGVLDFTSDPYAFLHELQEESAHGELVTNIFAAGTIDTERAFLTGATDLVLYRHEADSLARWFSAQGYRTEFCHAGYDWFYNRRNVAEYLGFDRSYFYEDRYNIPDGWGLMHDDEFLPDLAELMKDSLNEGEPYFNFSVTYQNHGPYSSEELERKKTYLSKDGLSEQAWYILNNYLAGIAETDKALRGLVAELSETDEPVVLVFFGDHNPWLGYDAWVYEELGISFEGEDGFYNYYCTPWVIWANDAAKELTGGDFSGYRGSFSPCYLSAELFDLLGWEGSGTVNALRELRDYADVVHVTGMVREDGVLTDSPSRSAADKIADYKKLEYYLRKDIVF